MHIKEMIEATKFKVSDGSEYLWSCYGNNARFMDFGDEDDAVTASCVFDTKTQEVYEVSLVVNMKAIRWINPKYLNALQSEYVARELDIGLFIDDIPYIDCTSKEEFLEKVKVSF
jgi:hypothetical protein